MATNALEVILWGLLIVGAVFVPYLRRSSRKWTKGMLLAFNVLTPFVALLPATLVRMNVAGSSGMGVLSIAYVAVFFPALFLVNYAASSRSGGSRWRRQLSRHNATPPSS